MIPKTNGKITESGERFKLPTAFCIRSDFDNSCLDAFLQRTGCILAETGSKLLLIKDPDLHREAYHLQLRENGICVTASREQGVILALTTVYQLLQNGELPCCNIWDQPRYDHRGLNLDCVRHFFPVEEVERIIEEISLVKMNVLHLQLGNDQGFRVESKVFPKLNTFGGPFYTRQQLRHIVDFAAVRGVEVIPEINMPGHTTAILAAYPHLSCSETKVELAQGGGIYPITLCPGKSEVYSFLEALLDEVIPLFPAKRIHLGGDEAPDWEWEKCPHCRRKMQEQGLQNPRQLQGYFTARIREAVRKHGKDVIVWCDSLEADQFTWGDLSDQQLQVQYWGCQHADAMQKYLSSGGRMIYSDMFEIYLDYPSAMSRMEKIYRCGPVIRDTAYAAEGMEGCMWTENVADSATLESRLFPRIFALAENCWCAEKDYTDFLNRAEKYISLRRSRGINCQSIEEADPVGEARKKGIMEYTAIMQSGMSPEMRELATKFTTPNEEFQTRFMQQFFGVG